MLLVKKNQYPYDTFVEMVFYSKNLDLDGPFERNTSENEKYIFAKGSSR